MDKVNKQVCVNNTANICPLLIGYYPFSHLASFLLPMFVPLTKRPPIIETVMIIMINHGLLFCLTLYQRTKF